MTTAKELKDSSRAYTTLDGQRKLVAYNFQPPNKLKAYSEQLCKEWEDCGRNDLDKFLKELFK